MAVKIRLQRHGKKNFAFFHIVVADTRAPRDGRFIEQLGSYNPNTNPATIVLNSERALAWLNVGAQTSLVVRRILSYEGVLLRKHLQGRGKATAAALEAAYLIDDDNPLIKGKEMFIGHVEDSLIIAPAPDAAGVYGKGGHQRPLSSALHRAEDVAIGNRHGQETGGSMAVSRGAGRLASPLPSRYDPTAPHRGMPPEPHTPYGCPLS